MALAQKRLLEHPAELAYLGEVVRLCLHDPDQGYFDGEASEYVVRPGSCLFGAPNRRELFILRPRITGQNVRADDRALRAMELHERFMHKRGTGFYECFYPAFRRPKFAGEIVIIHYKADKEIPGVEHGAEWVHFFEGPSGPAFPSLWALGHSQFYIPRGPYRVDDRGIMFHRDRQGE